MELGTHASPGLLLGITKALSETNEVAIAPTIDSRLAAADLDRPWLKNMAVNLEAIASRDPEYVLQYGNEFCRFLSWLCAPLKGNSAWLSINEEASRKSAEFYSLAGLTTPTNVQFLCWVAAYPLNKTELNFPTVLLLEDIDPDLEMAYLNLVEHLASHTWLGNHQEVDTTSLTLRLAGMVNSLEHEQDLRPAIQARILGLRGIIPDADMKLFNASDWISNFVGIRNAIAHVSEKGDGLYSLSEAWERSRELDHVNSVVRLCSYIMANEVRGNLLVIPDSHAKSWTDRVNEEMGWNGLAI